MPKSNCGEGGGGGGHLKGRLARSRPISLAITARPFFSMVLIACGRQPPPNVKAKDATQDELDYGRQVGGPSGEDGYWQP